MPNAPTYIWSISDENYISFIESLKEGPPAGPNNVEGAEIVSAGKNLEFQRVQNAISCPAYIAPEPPKSTPLLEALKAEKAAAKDAAQILSYHGHYTGADRRRAPAAAAAKVARDMKNEDETVYSRKAPIPGEPGSTTSVPNNASSKGDSKSRGPKEPKASAGGPTTPGKRRNNRSNSVTDTGAPQSPQQAKNKPQSKAQHAKATPSTSNQPAIGAGAADGAPAQDQAPKERERKRPMLNPRMFEAALAGVGGSRTAGAKEPTRKERREAKQPEGERGGSTTTNDAPSTVIDNKDKKGPKEKKPRTPKPKNKPARAPVPPTITPIILTREAPPSTPSIFEPVKAAPNQNAGAGSEAPNPTSVPPNGQQANRGAGASRRGRGRGRGGKGPSPSTPAGAGAG